MKMAVDTEATSISLPFLFSEIKFSLCFKVLSFSLTCFIHLWLEKVSFLFGFFGASNIKAAGLSLNHIVLKEGSLIDILRDL